LFLKLAGNVILRWYHNTLSLPTVLPTPDKADSTANGTSILPEKLPGIVSADLGKILYCHSPFRHFQLLRTIWGRG